MGKEYFNTTRSDDCIISYRCRNSKENTRFWNGNANDLNERINDLVKIIKLLKDSNILRLGTTKKIEKKTKEENGGFLDILFETLGASLLGNMLAYKSII